MQNVSPLAYRPPRRSSAVGLLNDGGKSNAPNFRSHSVDGFLDSTDCLEEEQRIAEAAAIVAAGSTALTNASSRNGSTSTLLANDDDANYTRSNASVLEADDKVSLEQVARREKSTNVPPNPQHRKSRSLDHFLDEQTLQEIVAAPELAEGTQSMQNLATPITPVLNRGVRTQPFSQRSASQRDSKSSTPERVALRHNVVSRQSPEGISSTEDEREDSQSSSQSCTPSVGREQQARRHSNRGSSNSQQHHPQHPHNQNTSSSSSLGTNNTNNKTFLNRTMKKVRSLIKK